VKQNSSPYAMLCGMHTTSSRLISTDCPSYIRAFEVGRPPAIPKYECHVKLKTTRDGAVIKNQIRLPNIVKADMKICVICPPDSSAAKQAILAGATLVGEDDVFQIIKSGNIPFDRCIAVPASLPKITKAGLPKILGPKGLMPSTKLGTVVENPAAAIQRMLGGSIYRERQGVVRMAVGQLRFTPEQLRDNIQAFLGKIKEDAEKLSFVISKDINEVVGTLTISSIIAHNWQVLSSTNSPGFSLTGEFRSEDSPPTSALSG
jgi:large subunit ribosomal protein L1